MANAELQRGGNGSGQRPSATGDTQSGAAISGAGGRDQAQLLRLRSRVAAEHSSGLFESTVGQTWILVTGIVLLLFGLGYFLKYSFDRNWIDPQARVGIAFAVGIFTAATGGWLHTGRFKAFGLFLLGGGIGMLYFATYAAFGFYGLIGQPEAFALMAGITAVAVALAVQLDSLWLAILGQFGGFLTPVLLSTGIDNQMALMSYMTILNIGLLSIAFFKQWTSLNFLGFVFTWLLFLGWLGRHYATDKLLPTTMFLSLFFLTYALIPYLYFFVRPRQGDLKGFWITIPNALLALACTVGIFSMAGLETWAGAVSLGYSAIFAGMALHLSLRNTENGTPAMLLTVQALAFAAVGVSLALSGGWLTLALALLGVAACRLALRQQQALMYVTAATLYLAATLKLAVYDYAQVFHFDWELGRYAGGFEVQLLSRWLAVGGVIAATWVAGQMIFRTRQRLYPELQTIGRTIQIAALVELFAALNAEVPAALFRFGSQAQTAGLSVLWTVFGAALMAAGFRLRWRSIRLVAMGLFAATLGKLFLFDMAHVETPFRILSFSGVGVILIAVSFLYHRFGDRLLPQTAENALPQRAAEAEALNEQPGWDQVAGRR